MSLPDLQQDLDLARAARRAILTGHFQSASEAGRSFTNLSLAELNTLIKDLESEIVRAQGRRIFNPLKRVNI